LGQLLIAHDTGNYFNENGSLKAQLGLDYVKCRSWRIDPDVKAPKPIQDPIHERTQSNINQQANISNAEADAKEFFNQNKTQSQSFDIKKGNQIQEEIKDNVIEGNQGT
jgi:hypothetical protein